MKITITVSGNTFELMDGSRVNVDGYDLTITEPGFDKSTSKIEAGRFVSKSISFSVSIREPKCYGMEPCSGLYKDANGKKEFRAYYD